MHGQTDRRRYRWIECNYAESTAPPPFHISFASGPVAFILRPASGYIASVSRGTTIELTLGGPKLVEPEGWVIVRAEVAGGQGPIYLEQVSASEGHSGVGEVEDGGAPCTDSDTDGAVWRVTFPVVKVRQGPELDAPELPEYLEEDNIVSMNYQ